MVARNGNRHRQDRQPTENFGNRQAQSTAFATGENTQVQLAHTGPINGVSHVTNSRAHWCSQNHQSSPALAAPAGPINGKSPHAGTNSTALATDRTTHQTTTGTGWGPIDTNLPQTRPPNQRQPAHAGTKSSSKYHRHSDRQADTDRTGQSTRQLTARIRNHCPEMQRAVLGLDSSTEAKRERNKTTITASDTRCNSRSCTARWHHDATVRSRSADCPPKTPGET